MKNIFEKPSAEVITGDPTLNKQTKSFSQMKKMKYIKPVIDVIRAPEDTLLTSLSTTVKEDPIPGGGDAKQRQPWEVRDWDEDTAMVKAAHQSLWD